jgi:hypothetical protein
MRNLRPGLAISILFVTPFAANAKEHDARSDSWCLESREAGGGGAPPRCTFASYEQCKASATSGGDR